MEFIPLERKKKKSGSLETSKKVDLPKKSKKQFKTLNNNNALQTKKVKNFVEEKITVKKPKNLVSIESKKKEVMNHRKKSLKFNDYLQEKNSKKNKSLDNKCNSENFTEEEEKEKLKLEKWKRLDEKKKK